MLIPYLLIINAAAFVLMLVDKQKAIKNLWRIPEAVLITAALLGGSYGGFLGMRIFRHKTKHLLFSLGLPVLMCIHTVLIIISLMLPFV